MSKRNNKDYIPEFKVICKFNYYFLIDFKALKIYSLSKLVVGGIIVEIILHRNIANEDFSESVSLYRRVSGNVIPRIGETVSCNDIEEISSVEVVNVEYDFDATVVYVTLEGLIVEGKNDDVEKIIKHYLNHNWKPTID